MRYEPSLWKREDCAGPDAVDGLRDRGFEPLRPERWSFPYVEGHLVAIDEASDDFALIDEHADELFGYPLGEVPSEWYSHLKRERNCLVITGVVYDSLRPVWMASRTRALTVGAMVMINDGRVHEGLEPPD